MINYELAITVNGTLKYETLAEENENDDVIPLISEDLLFQISINYNFFVFPVLEALTFEKVLEFHFSKKHFSVLAHKLRIDRLHEHLLFRTSNICNGID